MVSIIVPVYNAEKTIEACVESVLRQTYSDFELILIDDGSTDRSAQLCDAIHDRCAAQNVRCQVIHQQNGGVSRARNVGMAHVNGEYFVCIDSDDTVEPCYLEDLVRTAETHPELGHVLCGFRCTSDMHDYILSRQEQLSIVDRKDYMKLCNAVLIFSPCLGLYRTEIVKVHQLKMCEELSLGEDLLFNLAYLDSIDNSTIGVINKANYCYRNENQDSLNYRYRPDLFSVNKRIVQAIGKTFKKWGISDPASWEQYYNLVFFKYVNAMKNTLSSKNTIPFSQKVSFNEGILHDDLFRDALKKMTAPIDPQVKQAYESGNYRMVMLAEKYQKGKAFLRKVVRRIRCCFGA